MNCSKLNWREEIRQLLRIVDWFLDLTPRAERQFRQELQAWTEEKQMPFIPSFERLAHEEGKRKGEREGNRKGLLQGIAVSLKIKFGSTGLVAMPAVKKVKDIEKLHTLLESIPDVKTLKQFSALLPG